MNSEPTEPKTPVQRFVMRSSLKRCVRISIRGLARTIGFVSVLIHVVVLVLMVAYFFSQWSRPETKVCLYGGLLLLTVLVSCHKWFEDLQRWSNDSSA